MIVRGGGHRSQRIRTFGCQRLSHIEEDTFWKLWDRMEFKTLELHLDGQSPPDNVLWKRWVDGRGLISVKDKETSEFVCKLVKEVKVKGKSFRAWHKGEFGTGRLVTGFLKGSAFKGRTGEQLMMLLKKQNSLPGSHTGVVIKDLEDGRLMRFFADPNLWKDLVSRRFSQTNRKIKLKLGLSPAIFTLSKEQIPPGPTTTASEPTATAVTAAPAPTTASATPSDSGSVAATVGGGSVEKPSGNIEDPKT